jgi:short-subunit dehydrogenase
MTALTTLEGARVLVTGASSGIGAALAPMLAGRGATVGLVARRADRLADVLDLCQKRSPRADPGHRLWAADLSNPSAAADLALEAWDAFGGLDALVNNAGRPMRRAVQRLDATTVEDIMRTNFHSPVAMSLAVLPRMLERDRGVIVNVSSLGGRLGIANEAAYSASKFALCGWSEAMAMDLWPTGLSVRLVLPGAIATEIWDQPGNDPSPYRGPWEPPEDVAQVICDSLVGDRFEWWAPDMKAVLEFKTADIETFMASTVQFFAEQDSDS